MPRRTQGRPSKAPKGKPRSAAASASSTAPAPLDAPSRPTPAPSSSPSAIRLPQPPQENSYYGGAAVFAIGIMVVALLLYAIVREASVDRRPQGPAEVEDPLFEEVRHRDEFKDWVSKWRTVDPYVSAAEFTQDSSGSIAPARSAAATTQPSPSDLEPPAANRYVWSPDRTRYVDYLASFGEPDSTLTLYGRTDASLETLDFCGTPCHFDSAFWLDADRVAVLGRTEGLKQDGTPLCLPAAANEEHHCYDRLTLTVYDLARGARTSYRSENHLFGTNPYGPMAEERWASGLTPQERAELGISAASELETITGVIMEIGEEGRILTLGGGRVPRFLAVSEKATIRDVAGEPVPFEALHQGFMLEAHALRQPDGTSFAVSIKVLSAPNIIVDEPAENAEVHARFAVRGIARTFESNVQLRLVNDRSGKTLAEKVTTAAAPDAGKYGPFSFDLKLAASSARAGDHLTLEVFDTSAENGAKIDLVTLHLVYRP
ncbi:MAG TPA: Gmad2 immunoglobulin-like domain-containing protein [Candidatus Binatia bacterium]|nr:Gmad2 immunoglobulin-like domain-containing protein [Candidatus Binatia bacterium]